MTPSISPNKDEHARPKGLRRNQLKYGRIEMKTILAAITLSLFSVVALADPCMDADVSPLGYSTDLTPDELYLEQHGC
jgi:hypothetical protein